MWPTSSTFSASAVENSGRAGLADGGAAVVGLPCGSTGSAAAWPKGAPGTSVRTNNVTIVKLNGFAPVNIFCSFLILACEETTLVGETPDREPYVARRQHSLDLYCRNSNS